NQSEAGNQHDECKVEREEPRPSGDQFDFAEFTFFGCHKKAFSFVACSMPLPMPFPWLRPEALLACPSLPTWLTRQSSLPILWQPCCFPLLSWHRSVSALPWRAPPEFREPPWLRLLLQGLAWPLP